jgi:hypothetical protein
VTPVLVFDQFEEWFTKGTEQRGVFLRELSQLLDNQPPAGLRSDGLWVYERVPLAFVFSLREDYLAHLASLAEFVPGLRANEFRLLAFSEQQARAAIEEPARRFWPPDELFTNEVLKTLGQATLDTANYDPSILSLLLNRLFRGLVHADGVEGRRRVIRTEGQDVLLDFYRSALAAANTNPRELRFIESELVTSNGLRNSVALDDAIQRYRVRQPVLQRLREERLLHFDDRALGHQRVELAHDVLCGVVRRSRQIRIAQRRRIRTILASTAVSIVLVVGGIIGWRVQRERSELERERIALEQESIAITRISRFVDEVQRKTRESREKLSSSTKTRSIKASKVYRAMI